MTFKDPVLPDWLGFCISIPICIAAMPVAAGLLAMLGVAWCKRRILGPHAEWRRWFAWYPVKVTIAEWKWLEVVERRSGGILWDTDYRACEPMAVADQAGLE
ncbi:MAG: hypothetical protein VYD90_13165 [Pseudomonadota bacterium]|nr:hypothetical protein [Pseudomonadota bacterium]